MTQLYPTQNHPSFYRRQKIVYPVVSRRSGGISIGINLSPSKRCNFACVYCQVQSERHSLGEPLPKLPVEIDLEKLEAEIRQTVPIISSGELFLEDNFRKTPPEKRALSNFAFSGDGEPTLSPQFSDAVRLVQRLRDELVQKSVKMVLITNATTLRSPRTIEGCDILASNHGEIWTKLDGGTREIYHRMNRSSVPYETILQNIAFAAAHWPIKIQTMFLRFEGTSPSEAEITSYIETLRRLNAKGGKIAGLQLYTVARPPVDSDVSALRNEEMDEIAERIKDGTGLEAEVFYSR
ncbi:MAG: radical SAM protein [Thermoguttaceae bacterium]|jgi:wyosine [tRNA(Phe)-imidazoG37] synthetase (radical SAM superfamily)